MSATSGCRVSEFTPVAERQRHEPTLKTADQLMTMLRHSMKGNNQPTHLSANMACNVMHLCKCAAPVGKAQSLPQALD